MMQRVLHIRSDNVSEIVHSDKCFHIDDVSVLGNVSAVTVSFDSFAVFGELVYQLIIKTSVKRFVQNYMYRNLNYLNTQEQNIIYNEICMEIDKDKCIGVISVIAASRSVLSTEGIFNFLLNWIHPELEELCIIKAGELSARNEYLDFIRMLRFFADINYGNEDTVHVVMKSSDAADVYDKLFNIITDDNSYDTEISCLNEFIGYDSLISVLVETSPKEIILHNANKFDTSDICETLTNIFDERVMFCTGCSFCND